MSEGDNFALMQNDGLNNYGMITFQGTGTDHNPTTTPELITDFDSEYSSFGITTSFSANRITAVKSGVFSISITIHATVTDAETYTISIYKNGAPLGSLPSDVVRNTTDFSFNVNTMIGLDANDYIELFVNSGNAGGVNFTPSTLNMNVFKIGTL